MWLASISAPLCAPQEVKPRSLSRRENTPVHKSHPRSGRPSPSVPSFKTDLQDFCAPPETITFKLSNHGAVKPFSWMPWGQSLEIQDETWIFEDELRL